jgi:4-hydroxy-tetrahydrodipicolinate reductase
MNIAIIGYGKMGREVEIAAQARGHDIACIFDKDNLAEMTAENLSGADVAIEFTTPETAFANITACFNSGIPVVCGTTGWTERLPEIEQMCKKQDQTFFYASNFSIGVNIMFILNRWLAGVMNRFPDYSVQLSEVHHIHKKDSPSGTAITLAQDILKKIDRKTNWKNESVNDPATLAIISERRGEVPGTHVVEYKSPLEILEISHQALNRSVFASGAILAAEYIKGKKGIFKMDDLLQI